MDDNLLTQLPEGSVVAEESDFLKSNGMQKKGMKLILKSMVNEGVYRHYELGSNMCSLENIMPWLYQGMCYISEKDKMSKDESIVKKDDDKVKKSMGSIDFNFNV